MQKLGLLIAAMALVLAAGCKKKEETPEPAPAAAKTAEPAKAAEPTKEKEEPAADAKADIGAHVQGCMKAWNEKNTEVLRACYHADAVATSAGMPEMTTKGGDAIIGMAEGFWKTFPDMKGTSVVTLVNGDEVAVLTSGTGTMTGPMAMGPGQEMPATGNKVGGIGLQYMKYDGGKVKAEHGFWDMGQMMGQATGQEGVRPAGAGVPSVEDNPVVASGSEKEKANVATVKTHVENFGTKDAATVAADYAADAVVHDSGSPEDAKGTEAITAFFAGFKGAFPDIKGEIKNIWGAGDYVYMQVVVAGTNTGTMPPILPEPTNKAISLELGEIYRVVDGKITHQWVIGNSMSMAMQLGLIPDEGEAKK